MIVSYRDKRTSDFAAGKRVKMFSGIERVARLKLDRLEAAVELRDLAVLPGNRFEALKGNRRGQYSIRVKRSVADLLRMDERYLRSIECRDCRLPLGELPWR